MVAKVVHLQAPLAAMADQAAEEQKSVEPGAVAILHLHHQAKEIMAALKVLVLAIAEVAEAAQAMRAKGKMPVRLQETAAMAHPLRLVGLLSLMPAVVAALCFPGLEDLVGLVGLVAVAMEQLAQEAIPEQPEQQILEAAAVH